MTSITAIFRRRPRQSGFTLIELMVSMAIFLLISSAAFRLFSMQQSSASMLRDQVGLNLGLRNSLAQLELDISNAGSGYFQGINIPTWPVGVTILNNTVATGSSCYDKTKGTYGYNCFDQLNVIAAADPTTYPPVSLTSTSGGSNPTSNCSHTNNGVAYTLAAVVNNGGIITTWSLPNTAKEFKKADQLLLLSASGQKLTTVVLTADGSVNSTGTAVQLTFHATNTDGTNTTAYDPLGITTCFGNACTAASNLSTQFCAGDWVIKLAPITYIVCSGPNSPTACTDTSNTSPDIANPKLVRIQNGAQSVVMEQVVGFKIGAAIHNSSTLSTADQYQYNSSCYNSSYDPTNPCPTTPDLAYNFTVVRSVRASIIGRTTPNLNATYTYRNTFDNGPYQVQGMAVVVNPRNMSMND